MVPCFSKNGIGVHTAEISLILCQNYAMCHVCLWFMKKWLKICKNFNSQHWKSFFWLTYSLNKNFTKARPWGLRPCSKRVPKSTNLWTTPPIYELGRYLMGKTLGKFFWWASIWWYIERISTHKSHHVKKIKPFFPLRVFPQKILLRPK